MDINLTAREQEIKKALVTYTVSRQKYFTEFSEKLFSKYFYNADPDYTEINEVWDTFFSIARDDEKNYEDICNDLENYIENGAFNFIERGNISNTFEYYLQRLLIHIDDKVYEAGDKFRKTTQRKSLDLANTIKEFVDADGRAGFYRYNYKEKIDGSNLVTTFTKFDKCRDWRNATRGFHSNWVHRPHELMPEFIESFFLATIVYNYTKDIAAGFSIDTRSGSSVKVFKDEKIIFKIDKMNGNTAKIPIEKKYFGNSMKTTVKVVISATGFSVETKEYEVERGKFKRPFHVQLKKEDPEKQKNTIKELEEKLKKLQNELNNKGNRENAEPKKMQKTANPHYSLNGKFLKIESDTDNATIYYTLDKSTPTTKSNKYDQEITLERNCTVKAIAIADGMEDSEVTEHKVDCFKVENVKFEKEGRKLAMTTTTEISGRSTSLSEFFNKYWIWLAGIVFLALITFTIVRIGKNIHFSSGDEVPTEQSAITAAEQFPLLDGRSWIVKEMEGIKIPKGGSAKIVSMNDEGTECRMVIDTDLASQHREINLQYNRQTGDLFSPELGEGKVEKVTGFVSLKILFKGWIIEK